MAKEHGNKTEYDIFPRDQVEHYKIELSRLQSENEHLLGEVEYLRQALAAALSKIPQLDAPATAVKSSPVAASAATPEEPSARDKFAALQPYAQYFSLASLVASPVLLLIVLLVLALLCSIILAGGYFVLNL